MANSFSMSQQKDGNLDPLVRGRCRLAWPNSRAEHHAARIRAKAADTTLREVDDRIRDLYELVERGLALLDGTLENRLTELRQQRADAQRLKGIAERQKGLQ